MKLNSQKGMTMVMTLIVIFIFTMLGAAIWQYSTNSTAHTDLTLKNKQAYYIARSGAEAFSTYVFNNKNYAELTDTINRLIDKPSDTFEIGDKGGTCTLLLKRTGDIIVVEATGTYQDVTSKAVLELKEEDVPKRPFDNAIYATDNSYNSIQVSDYAEVLGGPVETNGKISTDGQPISFEYIEESMRYEYPRVTFPPKDGDYDIKLDPGQEKTIDSNSRKYYKELYIQHGAKLKFDTSKGDIIIAAENVRLYDDVIIEGPNRVYLYVKVKFLSQIDRGSMNNKPYYHEPIDSFVVLMPDTAEFTAHNFGGLLYAPGATIELRDAHFKGAMIGGNIKISGNTVIEHIPEAASVSPDIFDGLDGVTFPKESTSKQYLKGKWKNPNGGV